MPLYHCFGMVLGNLACTTHGAAMVYPAEAFEPEATLAAVQGERCTSLYRVPTSFMEDHWAAGVSLSTNLTAALTALFNVG